jgi:DNA-binding CsgD family transcriptional regulator
MEQPLTLAQLELVAHVANGLRFAEIAKLTHRSETSVKRMIATAQKRAGANTLPHLVSITIAEGLLVHNEEGPAATPALPGGSSPAGSPQATP